MEEFEPGTLGAIFQENPAITAKQARRNVAHLERRRALKALDHRLRQGEDIFEPVGATEARRELSDSGVFLGLGLSVHTRIEVSTVHPEEQAEHAYQGQTPQDGEYWQHRYK